MSDTGYEYVPRTNKSTRKSPFERSTESRMRALENEMPLLKEQLRLMQVSFDRIASAIEGLQRNKAE